VTQVSKARGRNDDLRPAPLPWFSLRCEKKLNQEGQDTAA